MASVWAGAPVPGTGIAVSDPALLDVVERVTVAVPAGWCELGCGKEYVGWDRSEELPAAVADLGCGDGAAADSELYSGTRQSPGI